MDSSCEEPSREGLDRSLELGKNEGSPSGGTDKIVEGPPTAPPHVSLPSKQSLLSLEIHLSFWNTGALMPPNVMLSPGQGRSQEAVDRILSWPFQGTVLDILYISRSTAQGIQASKPPHLLMPPRESSSYPCPPFQFLTPASLSWALLLK